MTTKQAYATRCVTAHAGARDFYQLSLALHEAGLLERLVTEAYAPDWLYAVAPEQARKRFCPGLPKSTVTLSKGALYRTIRSRLVNTSDTFAIDHCLSRTAYEVARRTNSNLFLYSYYGHEAFWRAIADRSERHRILFQLHPHPMAIRHLLAGEMERLPFAAQSIRDEEEFQLLPDQLHALAEEPLLATLCVTASQFTRATLIEHGVPAGRIRVVPYGVDTRAFPTRTSAPASRPFRVVFVGRMNQRKGLADLLQAVRLLNSRHVEVVICGRGYVDYNMLAEYRDLTINIQYALPTPRLIRELHQSHVFVLPSLAEGFGHVILEAMATGLPVITTANTCGPDVLTEGEHGYLVPIRTPEAIAAQLENAIRNPTDWFAMGQLAARQARLFTWARFRRGVTDVYLQATASQLNPAL